MDFFQALILLTLFSPHPEHQLQKLQLRTSAVMQQEVGQRAVVRTELELLWTACTAAGDQPGAYLRFFVWWGSSQCFPHFCHFLPVYCHFFSGFWLWLLVIGDWLPPLPTVKYTYGTTPRTRCRVQCSTEVSAALQHWTQLSYILSISIQLVSRGHQCPRNRGAEERGQIVTLIPLLSILHQSPGQDKLQADGKCKC